MINNDQSIPCPTCNIKVPFDVHQLLLGVQFVCPKCQGAIGLAQKSKDLVEKTMEKFEDVKSNILKTKKDNNMS